MEMNLRRLTISYARNQLKSWRIILIIARILKSFSSKRLDIFESKLILLFRQQMWPIIMWPTYEPSSQAKSLPQLTEITP